METEQELHKQVEQITKIGLQDRAFLLRFFSRSPLVIQVAMENRKRKTFHMLKERFSECNNETLAYCAHLLSIKSHYSLLQKLSQKKFEDMNLDEIRDVSMIKLKKENEKEYLKKAPKRQKVLHYWSIVKMMREQKPKPKSFDSIAKYLGKEYNLDVRHNLIAEMWREIEHD